MLPKRLSNILMFRLNDAVLIVEISSAFGDGIGGSEGVFSEYHAVICAQIPLNIQHDVCDPTQR